MQFIYKTIVTKRVRNQIIYGKHLILRSQLIHKGKKDDVIGKMEKELLLVVFPKDKKTSTVSASLSKSNEENCNDCMHTHSPKAYSERAT